MKEEMTLVKNCLLESEGLKENKQLVTDLARH